MLGSFYFMAEGLELLFRLKAQNQASPVVRAVQQDVAKLTQSVGGQFANLQQVSTRALGGITQSLTNVTARIPVLGTAVSSLSDALSGVATTSTGASAGLVGVAGAAGVMVIGFGAAIAVGVKLGQVLFDLTQRSAEFEGKFFDLSQQVGVSVETLSALNNIAENTGGNLDTVVGSLAIFQKHLEASHDPTSKEAKLLKDLGVTSLDTEVALRQTIAGLFRLGEGAEQTDAVLQLFGRSGRFVNAILKESEGDIDKAAAAFGPLSQVTSEAARAADAFNDSYNNLSRTLAGVGRAIVSDAIPVFINLFRDLNEMLTGNAEDWSFWTEGIRNEVAGVIASLQALVTFVGTGGAVSIFEAFETNMRAILERAEKTKNQLKFEADVAEIQRLTQRVLAGRPGDRPDAAKATADALAQANREIAAAQKAFEESFRFARGQLERERDKDLKSIEEWRDEGVRLVQDRFTRQTELLDQELAAVRRYIKNRADLQLAENEILQKRIKLTNDTTESLQKIEDDAQRRRDQSELRLNQQLFAIREAQRAGELEANKRFLDQGVILESEALRRQLEAIRQAHEERQILRDLEREQLSTSTARKIELINEQIEAEQRLTNETLRLLDERRRALSQEAAAGIPRPGGENPDLPRIVFDDSFLGPPPEAENRFRSLQEAIDGVGTSIATLLNTSKDFGLQFGDVIGGAIDSLAFGIGDLVSQWVLLGTTGPAAMRKLTASVLAGLAAQAAVKAIFQLAEGFAALFFNPAEAVAHFQSAALFASIAGAAAIAGRGLAGDLFKPESSGASSGTSGSPQPLNTIASRNQPASVNVTVLVKPDGSRFGEAITAHVVENYGDGGEIRQVIDNDGR